MSPRLILSTVALTAAGVCMAAALVWQWVALVVEGPQSPSGARVRR